MSPKPIYLFILAAAIVMSGCNISPQPEPTPRPALTIADHGGQVELAAGDLIVVTLEGNPSTGYTWEVQDLDTSMFEMVGEPVFESSSPGLVGAGGTLTLTFKALQPGTATLNLVYHRPWETEVEPADAFSVTVVVE